MTDKPVWDEGDWAGLPQIQSDFEVDVCVAGLGGSGLTAVDESLNAGRSVIGIDAGVVAGEAAGRNGGFLLAGMALFYHEARAIWGREVSKRVYQMTLDELERILDQAACHHTGSLRIADSEDELADIGDEMAALRADGFEVHPYDGREGEGMLNPGDGVCNPMRRSRDLVAGLIDGGAVLYEHSRATSIEPNRVETPGGVIEAEHIVVAIDGRLEVLFPQLGDRVRTARLEMLATAPTTISYRRPVYTAFGYIYWQQLLDGRVALGGMRNLFEKEAWTTEPGPTEPVQSALEDYLTIIGVDAPVTHRWAGHAAYTPDRVPIYAQIEPGIWVVGAYSGHGNVLGSVYARAAVQSAVRGEKVELL